CSSRRLRSQKSTLHGASSWASHCPGLSRKTARVGPACRAACRAVLSRTRRSVRNQISWRMWRSLAVIKQIEAMQAVHCGERVFGQMQVGQIDQLRMVNAHGMTAQQLWTVDRVEQLLQIPRRQHLIAVQQYGARSDPAYGL